MSSKRWHKSNFRFQFSNYKYKASVCRVSVRDSDLSPGDDCSGNVSLQPVLCVLCWRYLQSVPQTHASAGTAVRVRIRSNGEAQPPNRRLGSRCSIDLCIDRRNSVPVRFIGCDGGSTCHASVESSAEHASILPIRRHLTISGISANLSKRISNGLVANFAYQKNLQYDRDYYEYLYSTHPGLESTLLTPPWRATATWVYTLPFGPAQRFAGVAS
jgi:hypothetical protein